MYQIFFLAPNQHALNRNADTAIVSLSTAARSQMPPTMA